MLFVPIKAKESHLYSYNYALEALRTKDKPNDIKHTEDEKCSADTHTIQTSATSSAEKQIKLPF